MKTVIFHSIEQVQHFAKSYSFQDFNVLTTSPSVVLYCLENLNFEAQILSKYENDTIIIEKTELISEIIDNILLQLDKTTSPEVAKLIGVDIHYFSSLYSNVLKLQTNAYFHFLYQLTELIKQKSSDEIVIYDYIFNDFYTSNIRLSELLKFVLPEIKLLCINFENKTNGSKNKKKEILNILKSPSLYLKYFRKLVKIVKAKFLKPKMKKNRKTVLVFEDLYNLKFIHNQLDNYNVVYYHKYDSTYPSGVKDGGVFDKTKELKECLGKGMAFLNYHTSDSLLQKVLKFVEKNIFDDADLQFPNYAKSLKYLDSIHKEYNIQLGIWGNSPAFGFKALAFEYLLKSNVKIIGAQHGNCYGDQPVVRQKDLDYTRCTHYFSFGFTQEDFYRFLPFKNINIQILPYGRVSTKLSSSPILIDILFPITISFSSLSHTSVVSSPDKIFNYQLKILEKLNTLIGLNIHVKTYPYPSLSIYPFEMIESKLNHLKFIKNIYLTDYLNQYVPKIAIIELPSTPFYDILHLELDTEIFMLSDSINPFEEVALKELQKRVYYFENVEDLLQSLDLYLAGKRPKKRDNTFLNHYIAKPNTKEKIIAKIHELVEGK